MKTKHIILIFSLFINLQILGQVTVDLNVENQNVIGTDFYFEIYLTSTGPENLYLGNADFVFIYANSNFDSPSISIVGDPPGSCTFSPINTSGSNIQFTRDLYFNNTSVELSGQEIIINLNGPTPSNQTVFDTRIAKIDNSSSTHCLGKFKVTGISNPTGTMDLTWKVEGEGVITKIFSLSSSDPWLSTNTILNAIDPEPVLLPVELTMFTANLENTEVHLAWATATENNNHGFDVERKLEGKNQSWEKVAFVEGMGNSSIKNAYNFVDNTPIGGSKFSYRLKQIDFDGKFEYSDEVYIEIIPNTYELFQNYPNPFNPSTTIRFSLIAPQVVNIKLYNVVGEEVTTVINQKYELGYHEVELKANYLASGVYYYRIIAGDFVQVKKLILLK